MSGFLGNFSMKDFGNLMQDAAEIYRPGGNLADLRQNRIAQKLLEEKSQREQEEHEYQQKIRAGQVRMMNQFFPGSQPPQVDALTPPELGVPDDVPRFPEVALVPEVAPVPDDVPKFQEGGMSPAPSLEDNLAQLKKPIEIINQDVALDAPLLPPGVPRTDQQGTPPSTLPNFAPSMQDLPPWVQMQIAGDPERAGIYISQYKEQQIRDANTDRRFGLSDAAVIASRKRFEEGQEATQRRFDETQARASARDERADRPQTTAYVSADTGNPVMRDPVSNSFMDGENAIDAGRLIPANDFNKHVEEANVIGASIARSKAALSTVTANPQVFDQDRVNKAKLAGDWVPIYGKQIVAKMFTPEENKIRAGIAQEAAMIINKLYGAAVSAGEMERAESFLPASNAILEEILPKLEQAVAWGEQQKLKLYPGAVLRSDALLDRGGGGQGSGGIPDGIDPEDWKYLTPEQKSLWPTQ